MRLPGGAERHDSPGTTRGAHEWGGVSLVNQSAAAAKRAARPMVSDCYIM